jgi:hypothetical protein
MTLAPVRRLAPGACLARHRAALLLSALLAAAPAVGAAGAAGCAGRRGGAPVQAQEETTLRVRNQSFLSHNVYVLYGSVRTRLGTVSGNSTAVLRIPPSFVQPGTPLRFIADPIGSRVSPVSDQVVVSPGDEVQLTIPPR